MYYRERLSTNVRHMMHLRSLAWWTLTRRAGIDPRTLRRVFDAERVERSTVLKIASALGIPVEALEYWSVERINRRLPGTTRWARFRAWLRRLCWKGMRT